MPEAQAATQEEDRNIVTKQTVKPARVRDWRAVRQQDPPALIGSARMILGRKGAELEPVQ